MVIFLQYDNKDNIESPVNWTHKVVLFISITFVVINISLKQKYTKIKYCTKGEKYDMILIPQLE